MYSVLIVDDERFMREGIRRMLPWEELKIDHVETAESGKKALLKMQDHMPDLVLTDIEMKNMNGLQLIHEMNQLNPNLRIIVLTGHDNFTYVQECCRMEVHDYLLKPVEVSTLSEAIRKQINALEKIAEEKSRKKIIERVNGLSEHTRVARLFRTLLETGTVEREVKDVLQQYGCREGDSFQIALIPEQSSDSEEWQQKDELLSLSIDSVCVEMVEYNNDGVTFRDANNTMVLLLFLGDDHPEGIELLEDVQTILQNEYNTAKEVYLGTEVDSLEKVVDSYKNAMQMWNAKRQDTGIIQADLKQNTYQLQKGRLSKADATRKLISDIVQNIDDAELGRKLFRDYFDHLSPKDKKEVEFRKDLIHIMSEVYMEWTDKTGISDDALFTQLLNRSKKATTEELFNMGINFLESILTQTGESDDVITNVKKYINAHLDENLSVTMLASKFYLSVAYFSKLFKKKEGVGCNYYIITRRMELAKELLAGHQLKVTEVARRVGYEDVAYFSLTFKKYTGTTPAEF